MKAVSVLFVCLFAVSAQAQQSRGVKSLAQDVNELVQQNIDLLPQRDRQEVRYSLRQIEQTFEKNGFRAGGGYPPPSARNLICDSSDNTLRDLSDGGRLVHDFNDSGNCAEAKGYVIRGEPYCDYSDNKLYSTRGALIFDFNDSQNCQQARVAVIRGANFCDFSDNTLRDSSGKLIYDFGSSEDCKNGLNQTR